MSFASFVHHTSSSTLSVVDGLPSSFIAHSLDAPESLKDHCVANNLNGYQSAKPMNDLNILLKPDLPFAEYETRLDNLTLNAKPPQKGTSRWHRKINDTEAILESSIQLNVLCFIPNVTPEI